MLSKIKTMTFVSKIKIFSILLMLFAAALTFTTTQIDIYDFDWEKTTWGDGFSQLIAGEEIALANISEFQNLAKGETLILTNEIPVITNDKILLFYSKDLEVRVSIDDTEIYSFLMDEQFEFLKTPGNKWNAIKIPAEMSGQSIRIELTSNFSNRYTATLDQLFLVNQNETLITVLSCEAFRIFGAVFVFFMALFAYANTIIWKRPFTRNYFFYLGHLYLCTALWLASMCSILNFIFKKPAFSYIISMFMAVFLPVVVYEFTKRIYQKRNRIINYLGYLTWSNFILQMTLQFVFHVSLLDLLPLTYFVFAVGAAIAIVLVIYHIITCKSALSFPFASLSVIFYGAIAEIVVLCLLPQRTDLIGVAGTLGLFVYLVANHFNTLFFESRIDTEKLKLEKNYYQLQNTTLIQEIKAHFFFNTLNTISALCKYDPKEADNAISVFSRYMRSYMQLITEHENIPFEKELQIVEASLQIEKLRFPDTFTYQIDLDVTDFSIPPLSIQPIVENAMIHGLRKADKPGTIIVKTKQFDDCIQIIVTDNGVGFDTDILKNNKSVALTNLQKRLKIMINGDCSIKSELMQGTEVIFTFPYLKS